MQAHGSLPAMKNQSARGANDVSIVKGVAIEIGITGNKERGVWDAHVIRDWGFRGSYPTMRTTARWSLSSCKPELSDLPSYKERQSSFRAEFEV